jgi:putative nucleotidyltransferase with HDIG domain
MAGSPTSPKSRRRAAREQRVRTLGSWYARLASYVFSWPALLWILLSGTVITISLAMEEPVPYTVGERIRQPIYARVDFSVEDVKQTQVAKENAAAATPSYYRHNPAPFVERVRADLRLMMQAARDSATFADYQKAMATYGWPAAQEAYERLRGLTDTAGEDAFKRWIDAMPLTTQHIVADLTEQRSPPSRATYVRIVSPDSDAVDVVENRYLISQASKDQKDLKDAAEQLARAFPSELRSTVAAVLVGVMSGQPTTTFDARRTQAEIDAVIAAQGRVYTTFSRGLPFIDPHVTGDGSLKPEQFALLQAEQAAYLAFLATEEPGAESLRDARFRQRAGLVGTLLLLSIGLFAYIGFNRPRMFTIRSRMLALIVLVGGTLTAARVLDWRWPSLPELMLTPVLLASAALAIVYPPRLALGLMCFVVVMLSVVVRQDVSFMLTMLTGLAVTVYTLADIRTRTKIISSGLLTAAAVALASISGGLLASQHIEYVWHHAAWAAMSVLASSFIFTGILPFIERIFRIATPLTLLEWRDPTRPLLQLLAREAPGTYNHSLVVGNMAEAACEAIGANGLLAQVGALYHDIGKVYKPDYFTENSGGSTSRHDNLAPSMSLLIILAHVKDGLELAKEYKLPVVLHSFIEEHHGTTVVRYFHHRASELQPQIASGRHDREVSENEFRYAGPKPRTLETAVMMMCDSVEGAVRSLSEPTPGRIESMVHTIFMERLSDGQFDDCPITLKEIRLAEEAIVKTLCSVYHGRVAYPKAIKNDDSQRSPGTAGSAARVAG